MCGATPTPTQPTLSLSSPPQDDVLGMILVNVCEGFLSDPHLTWANDSWSPPAAHKTSGDLRRAPAADTFEGFELCCGDWAAVLKAPRVE